MPQEGIVKVSHSYFVTSLHAHTCKDCLLSVQYLRHQWVSGIVLSQGSTAPASVSCHMKDASYVELQWQLLTSLEAPQKSTLPDLPVCAVFCAQSTQGLSLKLIICTTWGSLYRRCPCVCYFVFAKRFLPVTF